MAPPRASKPFTDTMLANLPLGAKVTDCRAQGLAARRLNGGVTFEWRGRIRGDKATVRLGIWWEGLVAGAVEPMRQREAG
jgi:hypothetical protein